MRWLELCQRVMEVWRAALRSRKKGIPAVENPVIVPLDYKRRMLWLVRQNARRRQVS